MRASSTCGHHQLCGLKEMRVRTHHVFNLREGDLQGDVESTVGVFYRPQGAGVILHQIIQELLGVATLSRVNHWGERCQECFYEAEKLSYGSVMIIHKPHLQEAASPSRLLGSSWASLCNFQKQRICGYQQQVPTAPVQPHLNSGAEISSVSSVRLSPLGRGGSASARWHGE